jgi:hypothetical protein
VGAPQAERRARETERRARDTQERRQLRRPLVREEQLRRQLARTIFFDKLRYEGAGPATAPPMRTLMATSPET